MAPDLCFCLFFFLLILCIMFILVLKCIAYALLLSAHVGEAKCVLGLFFLFLGPPCCFILATGSLRNL